MRLTLFLLLFSLSLTAKPYHKLFKQHNDEPRSSIKAIDAIYVINLDARPEKWHRAEPLLCYHGIDASRFSAVFGLDLDIPTTRKFGSKHLRSGALGCMLSHLSIYQDALDRGLKTIWVLEDDIDIRRNPKVLTKLIHDLDIVDPHWDILYTDPDWVQKDGKLLKNQGTPIDKPIPHSKEYYKYRENVTPEIQLVRSRFGTGSMIVSSRGMRKILHHFNHEDIVWPIDVELHLMPDLHQYGIINPVVTNAHFDANYSDAGQSKVNKFYEIDDEHVAYMLERQEIHNGIYSGGWLDFMCLEKTPKKK